VEGNSDLGVRLERALFEDHFEVLHLSEDRLSPSQLENQYLAFQSAGLVVIYSADRFEVDSRRRLEAIAPSAFFDISKLKNEAPESFQSLLAILRGLRT
jgi:hypothetical protein